MNPRISILFLRQLAICSAVFFGALAHSAPTPAALRTQVETKLRADYSHLEAFYKDLHLHPELSFFEEQTAKKVAAELEQAGCAITTRVGGHGVVAVLKNGDGPTVLVRSDLDALPVKEQTGLPYASQIRTTDMAGNEVPVMHACGHDIHMTSLVGTARMLSHLKEHWRGTVVFIGQPAEEKVGGAKKMLADGLFTRFPRPDFCVALHVASDMPAGTVGYTEGFALANSDSVDIVIRGVGGHGAWPNVTKDPIVLAAQTVLALQTIVSRETPPTEPAVVTVGSIHGGTKHNIIPDEVRLQLTLRSYSDEVRDRTIAAIKRITRGLAEAAGVPEDRLPLVTVAEENAKATYNDPVLTQRLAGTFRAWLGAENVFKKSPVMGAEDFALYGRTEHKIPICIYWLGTVNAESVKESLKANKTLPALHSGLFAPVPEPTIKTGITSMTAAVLELLPVK